MLITTDMKVSTLLQQNQKAFLAAAYASPQLYPLTHGQEVLAETFSLFAAIHPDGTLADLLDFMAGSCASAEARQKAFVQLEGRLGRVARQQRAAELAGLAVLPPAVLQQELLGVSVAANYIDTLKTAEHRLVEVTELSDEQLRSAKPAAANPFSALAKKR